MDHLLLGKVGLVLGAYALYCCRGYLRKKFLAEIDVKIIRFVRRKISYRVRRKSAQVALRIFQITFTHYRLSRTLLLLGCHKLRMLIISNNLRKQTLTLIDSEEEGQAILLQFPGHIMLLILQRLQIQDYLRCRAVCRPWRAIIDKEIASKQCSLFAPQLPWLMLSPNLFSAEDHCVFNLSDWRTYYSYPSYYSNMKRLDCVGSIEGWLFMVDSALWRPEGFMKPWSFYLQDHQSFDTLYFLLNPITGARVMLPSTPQSTFPCGCENGPGFVLTKLTASSTPTSSSHYCFFVASICIKGHVSICRPGDQSWTRIETNIRVHGLAYQDIEIMDGRLYAVTTKGFVVLVDIQFHDVNDSGAPLITYRVVTFGPCPLIFRSTTSITSTRVGSSYMTYDGGVMYLAKDSTTKEMFIIIHLVHSGDELDPTIPWEVIAGTNLAIPFKTRRFQVFKLKPDDPDPRISHAFDLGDRMLFVSRSGCKVMHATSDALEYIPNRDRLERNGIYFAFDSFHLASASSENEFGTFSLATRRLEFFPWPFLKNSSRVRFNSRPVWFIPNL